VAEKREHSRKKKNMLDGDSLFKWFAHFKRFDQRIAKKGLQVPANILLYSLAMIVALFCLLLGMAKQFTMVFQQHSSIASLT
jgi:hypothetical protein